MTWQDFERYNFIIKPFLSVQIINVYYLSLVVQLLPIRNKMAQPVALIGYCGALNQALAVVLILNLAMSILGYLCFGNNILSSITLNLPTEDWYSQEFIFFSK